MVKWIMLFSSELPDRFSSKLSGLEASEKLCVRLICRSTFPVFIVGFAVVSPADLSVVVVTVVPFLSLVIFTSFSTVLFSEQESRMIDKVLNISSFFIGRY